MTTERGHKHSYSKHQIRVDFCHFVVVQRFCTGKECEQMVETEVPRDFNKNPLQVAFARQDCDECRRLLIGKEPASWGVTTA
jgi:hypothetical protein